MLNNKKSLLDKIRTKIAKRGINIDDVCRVVEEVRKIEKKQAKKI
jgi:hypothetical protein